MEEMTAEEIAAIEELKVNLGNTNAPLGSTNEEEIKPLTVSLPFIITPEMQEKIDKENERQAAQVELERERVFEQYSKNLDDRSIRRILRQEEKLKECENCTGLPCKKSNDKCQIPEIEVYASCGITNVKIKYSTCKYERVRRIQAAEHKKFGLSKIPPEYLGKTFEDYQVDTNNAYAVEVAKKLIEHPEQGAYFFGGVGTGKTFLAAIIAQEAIKRGRSVIFVTVPTISVRIRSTFQKNSTLTEGDVLEKLYTVPTLILDDIGIEKPTRFVCSTLCNIFNERYNARLQTIMTSNYQLKELENIFNNPTDENTPTFDGSRIYDRCKQMCIPIELKGRSRR